MATTYPGALDTFTNKKVIDLEDAIEALEARIGITGSADTSSVTYLLSKSVRTDTNQTITGEKTFQQVSGSIPLRIHSTEPQSGTHLLEVLGPSRSGGAERYTFMIDQGGNVRMNTALTISGGTADVGNIPPEPIAGASYAIGILNDIAPGGGGMDRDAGILSVLGIPGQIHMRCFDSSEQLQFEIGPTGAVKVQLWEPTAIGIHVRGSFGQSGKLLRLWNSDSTEMFGVSAAGAVTAAGGAAIGGNLTTTSVSSPKIAFIGNPDLQAGIACETGGTANDILNIGVNDTRFGTQYAALQGGFLRFDSRTGQPVMTVYVRPASGSLVSAMTIGPDKSVGVPGTLVAGTAGAPNDVIVRLATPARDPGGLKGMEIERGSSGGALTLAFMTGGSSDWGVGLDFNVAGGGGDTSPQGADFVLAYDARGNGVGSTADVMRLRHGPFLTLGNTALPDTSARFKIVSNGTFATSEPATLTTLLLFEIGDAASGITHLIKANAPGAAFGVTKAGWVSAGTTTNSAPFHAQSTGAIDALRIQTNAGTDPGSILFAQGSGSLDWRIGRTVDGNSHLQITSANGSTTTTAAAPGAQVVLITRTGATTLTSLAATSFPLTVNAAAGTAYPNYIQQWKVGGTLKSGIIPDGSFLAVGTPGVQLTVNTSFDYAAQVAMAIPGGSQTNDLVFSSYTSPDATWTETARIINKLGHLKVLGALVTKRTTAPADADLATSEAGIWFNNTATRPTARLKCKDSAGTVFTGALLYNSASQTTVGAAGGASALPATPTKYLKVVGEDGAAYVVAAYAVS